MTPPDLMTKTEERQLAEMIETNVDFWQEQKHIHEVELAEANENE